MATAFGGASQVDFQLFDQSETTLLPNDDRNLVASGSLLYDSDNVVTQSADIFPDNFGKLNEARMVINDTLYLLAENHTAIASGKGVYVTVRIKAKLAKLDTKDWMAIAIQSTASDN